MEKYYLAIDIGASSGRHNLTNEGGYQYRFRYLKNIMGPWMIQSVKKEIGGELDFGEICKAASKCDIASIVDCNDDRFLAPANMTEEVKAACRESGQKEPEGIAEVAAIGNLLVQMIADGVPGSLEDARKCILESFWINVYGGNA